MGVASKIKLTSFDSLFGDDTNTSNGITEVKISELRSFKDHPFKVVDDDKMADMVESIKEYGVLSPIIVRKSTDSGYEIISGHRRKFAAEKAELETIPAIIKELSDDEATIFMVDSNLQREEILPSEKAFSYKMKAEALKRTAGRPKNNYAQVEHNLKGKPSVEIIAEETGESRATIQRYIRLTFLISEFLDMVDNKKMPFNVAVEISYLTETEQKILCDKIEELNTTPSIKQAARLKEYSKDNKLDKNVIDAIMTEEKEAPIKVSLSGNSLKRYFPNNYTAKEIEKVIYNLLEEWKNKK